MLIAGLVTLAGVITSIYAGMDHLSRLVAVPGILVVVAAFGFGLAAVQRGRSPRAGRLLDIVEVLLIVAIIPLAFWASGLYEWARSLPTR
jgi:hypothetical protein